MKILHTADWHLGQKFRHLDREQEHIFALDWLIEVIKKEKIELLIIAGDVFDIGNPPNYAQKLYYRFFKALLSTSCEHCIVIGGNHDSPSMLNAPKDLLDLFNISVISAATDNLQDEIIEIKNKNGNLKMVVAAVPFLRDRDLKAAYMEETAFEKAEQIKVGIYKHYQTIAELCEKYKGIPIVATGHLFAKSAEAPGKENRIYAGNLENISAEQFPDVFDYVALGHIHRAQKIGERENIRYSGSLIPLSFSEVQDIKSVTVIDFEGKKIKNIELLNVPNFRKLKLFRGNLEEVKEKISKHNARFLLDNNENKLRTWAEIQIESDTILPDLDQKMTDFVKDMYVDIIKLRIVRSQQSQSQPVFIHQNLKDMSEMDVFQKRLESVEESEREGLLETFKELLEIVKS
jgi:DNA repair protein SbcD/Mre11